MVSEGCTVLAGDEAKGLVPEAAAVPGGQATSCQQVYACVESRLCTCPIDESFAVPVC